MNISLTYVSSYSNHFDFRRKKNWNDLKRFHYYFDSSLVEWPVHSFHSLRVYEDSDHFEHSGGANGDGTVVGVEVDEGDPSLKW